MKLDGTSALELELVVFSQSSNNTSWILRCNREIVYVDGDVFVVVINSTHPNAWISMRRKESHAS
jgi:hypothetical protein